MSSSRERYQTKRRLFEIESYAAVAVNLMLAIAASFGLVRLVSYNFEQQVKVDLLDEEVEKTRTRVDQVREEFGQYFDPYQSTSVVRQQSHRIEPGQARIILTQPEQTAPDTEGLAHESVNTEDDENQDE
ncbi:MAG: hypothetical protein AAFR31_19340 [Cyanobacteria bacterium J06627_8]